MRREVVIGTEQELGEERVDGARMWYMVETNNFYILNMEMFDIKIYIYKDSPDGKEMDRWLSQEENRDNERVQKKALELLLPRLTIEEFFEVIDKEKSASWEGGYKKAQYDIRKALGI